MIDYDYISSVITSFESRQLQAYIPCRRKNFTGDNSFSQCGEVIGSSGVTVASGLDLGQQNAASLVRMGIPEDLRTRFAPYLGKKKTAAVDALAAAPFRLTESECDAVDRCVHRDYIDRAGALFDKHTCDLKFAECPRQVQAVISSLFYQLGAYNGNPGYRILWKHLTDNSWEAAADELLSGFTRYRSRREAEGRLLEEVC